MVILDTDVMIDLLHGHPPAVAWLESLGDTEVCLPGFVAMELIRGCRNGQERRKLKKQISRYAFCSLSPRTARPRCPCSRTFTWPLAWGVLHALTGWTAVASGCPLYAFNDVSMSCATVYRLASKQLSAAARKAFAMSLWRRTILRLPRVCRTILTGASGV